MSMSCYLYPLKDTIQGDDRCTKTNLVWGLDRNGPVVCTPSEKPTSRARVTCPSISTTGQQHKTFALGGSYVV